MAVSLLLHYLNMESVNKVESIPLMANTGILIFTHSCSGELPSPGHLRHLELPVGPKQNHFSAKSIDVFIVSLIPTLSCSVTAT